ncbi:maleylpyruvate isomerase family mycothiol-dependent enzyme [Streptomyces sclerotialus]|uniref:maleylpyruvate isomerase family mycothiol-dependent enzyme n=1 Tax=Streptomyces sclerotialus TaxID=1957 RepID=UPI0004C8296E
MAGERDPWLPGRLLRTERDALMPLLRGTEPSRFAARTACPGWTVRDVLAHCGAALVRIVEGRLDGAFTPEANAADVRERADWTTAQILDELERGLTEAGPVIAASDGELDVIALGEWVHAGDVREALDEPGAYGGRGAADALAILSVTSRVRHTPRLHAVLAGHDAPLVLGNEVDGRPAASLKADVPTLIRLYAGRPLVRTRYELHGATESELVIYG